MHFTDPRRDPWQRCEGEDGPLPHPDAHPDRLLTLAQWHAVRAHWPAGLDTGVVLPNDADPSELGLAHLHKLALVELRFPSWTDGRAYSQARLLRLRWRFRGQLRAAGEVLVDMLPLLARTGFDAVVLRADQARDDAERALAWMTGLGGHYQGDAVEPRPAFARRSGAPA